MNLSWKEYYILQAVMVSLKSKDASTKVGCVIVDDTNTQVSMGYNGFPRGIDESGLSWSKDMLNGLINTKIPYVVHSEVSALLNASRSVRGCDVYVTLQPCSECAKTLAASRIKRVFYLNERYCEITEKIFRLAGITQERLIIDKYKINGILDHVSDLLK